MNNQQIRRLNFEVGNEDTKCRLDDFLFAKMTTLSKMYLRELVKRGYCEVNGNIENLGYKLRTNDFIELEADLSRGTAMQPEDIPLNVVFEDAAIIVVDKPPGMLVHPTHRDKNGTLLNALAFHLNIKRSNSFTRPGLVHRLDKETSGLMVVAKTAYAHRNLSNQFMRKLVTKKYRALVSGEMAGPTGVIDAAIGRYADRKEWDIKADGKHSITRYRVLSVSADQSLLELEPVTGRTNQLRIHCASAGHPIVGDVQRGGREFRRLCLHACRLSFTHPTERHLLRFESSENF